MGYIKHIELTWTGYAGYRAHILCYASMFLLQSNILNVGKKIHVLDLTWMGQMLGTVSLCLKWIIR